MRSSQALSWLGMEKLYIGAPMTTVSARRNSSSAAWLAARSLLQRRRFRHGALGGGEMLARQMRQRLGGEIAGDDFQARRRLGQLLHHGGEAAGWRSWRRGCSN